MRNLAVIAGLGSLAMLLGAFYFQYVMDLAPCKMCIWQRWPHAIAIGLGLIAFFMPLRSIVLLGAAVVTVGAVIAAYHTGVEQGWFAGPNTCTSGDISNLSTDDLMAQILAAPVVRCDEIVWSLFGLSMAAWNGVISIGLAAMWLTAFRKGATA